MFEVCEQALETAERIAVVNDRGLPLGIDKSLRLAQTFDTRSAEHVAPLLDSIEEVLAALTKAGISFTVHTYDYDPHAERIGRETVTLPLFPAMQDDDVERVCAAVGDFITEHSR